MESGVGLSDVIPIQLVAGGPPVFWKKLLGPANI